MPKSQSEKTITYSAKEIEVLIANDVKKNLRKPDKGIHKDKISVDFNVGSRPATHYMDGPSSSELISCTVTVIED